jgi:hypothetical protein
MPTKNSGTKRKPSIEQPTEVDGCYATTETQSRKPCEECPYYDRHGRMYCSGICTTINTKDATTVSLCNRWTDPSDQKTSFFCFDHRDQEHWKKIVIDRGETEVQYKFQGHRMKVRVDRSRSPRRFVDPVLDYFDAEILSGHGLSAWKKNPQGFYSAIGKELTDGDLTTGLQSKLDNGVSIMTTKGKEEFKYTIQYTRNSGSSLVLQKIADEDYAGNVLKYLNEEVKLDDLELGQWQAEDDIPPHSAAKRYYAKRYYVEGPNTNGDNGASTFHHFQERLEWLGEVKMMTDVNIRKGINRYSFFHTQPGLTLAERASRFFYQPAEADQ